jgi:hypothetical protein
MNLIPTGAGLAPKYPDVVVNLVGKDANPGSILGRFVKAMDEVGVPQAEIDLLTHAAMAHDCDHLLRTVMVGRWCGDTAFRRMGRDRLVSGRPRYGGEAQRSLRSSRRSNGGRQ